MAEKTVGVVIGAANPAAGVEKIKKAEAMGIRAAWLTSAGGGGESVAVLAAAAPQTSRILLGTAIVQIWPRHPVSLAQQTYVIANLAPGRLRLGLGTSGRAGMESTFGADFRQPLGHLREYVSILKALLQQGSVELDGRHYKARARLPAPVDVPVMVSALGGGAFEMAGEAADGAISWVCPHEYMRTQALPALQAGARKAGRASPPLLTHAVVCVHDDVAEARKAALEQLGGYPRAPFYARMFAAAGFPRSDETGWTADMVSSVLLTGDERAVRRGIQGLFAWGTTEVLATVVTAGPDPAASEERTWKALAGA